MNVARPQRPRPDHAQRIIDGIMRDAAAAGDVGDLAPLIAQFRAFKENEVDSVVALVLSVFMVHAHAIRKLQAQALHFEGRWEPRLYTAGSLAQRQGGLWLAKVDNADMPPSPAWRLLVKRGSLHEDRE